ncbi:hypothetical protein [Actinomadura sp. 21ATH]
MSPQALMPPIPFDITLPNTTMTRTAYTTLLAQINAALRNSGC